MWRKPGRSLVRAAIQWQEVGVPFKPAISPLQNPLVRPSGAWHLLNWRFKLQNAVSSHTHMECM